MTSDPHVYASPWCSHGKHQSCHGKCPVCKEWCVCSCHDQAILEEKSKK